MVTAAVMLLVTAPSTASAATANIHGYTTSSSWVNYQVSRTSTLSTVKFKPSDLLYQAGPVSVLNLRLRNLNGSWLSSSTQWQNHNEKNIMTGLSVGTRFTISACCYSSVGKDDYWAGRLTY